MIGLTLSALEKDETSSEEVQSLAKSLLRKWKVTAKEGMKHRKREENRINLKLSKRKSVKTN
jgi:hypothetical protein